MTLKPLSGALAAVFAMGASAALAEDATLVIESWREDDRAIWEETIIPAFEASHPGIKLRFAPTASTEYDTALRDKLDAGTAGDLVTCRPFDVSLRLFDKGQLADLSDLPELGNFSTVARSGWSTDDGLKTFCVPVASVIHGFLYNRDIFRELGLAPPRTGPEFFALLDRIKADGSHVAMAMGTKDEWEAATMGFQNIGPNHWRGEEGRLALIAGSQKLTDEPWVEPLREIAKWKDYLGEGFETRSYSESKDLFSGGRAAIYPAGSWEIAALGEKVEFEIGAFPPPLGEGDETCYISDQADIGIGMNAETEHPEAARAFLSWVGTPEFAKIHANALPGFFSLASAPVALDNPLAAEFASWRETCRSTIRSTYQILSRGTPNLETETWAASANVLRGAETPEAAAKRLQDGLASWYAPQQGD